jgi:hypothetical protein
MRGERYLGAVDVAALSIVFFPQHVYVLALLAFHSVQLKATVFLGSRALHLWRRDGVHGRL